MPIAGVGRVIRMQLTTAAKNIEAQLRGRDDWFEGVSTDSRTIKSGELFCALRGANFDGHEHCAAAQEKGAVAVLVDHDVEVSLPVLRVNDTKVALGHLAHSWRRQFTLPVIGVTGSNGKTTVKEMIASVLGMSSRVLATQGNLNNDIGVPQTLFELDSQHEYAVIEMGASHLGEIEWLAEIAQPRIGVITLCAPAHLEGFGTIDRVAQAKSELYAALGDHGVAVINADDEFAPYWREVAKHCRRIQFGLRCLADVAAEKITNHGLTKGMSFTLQMRFAAVEINLPFDGLHNVSNALAAAAVATTLQIPIEMIKRGLENTAKVAGRLCVVETTSGARIIDDTYNANPTSLAAAIDLLATERREKWLVLGDMGELGPGAATLHEKAGAAARGAGVDRLFTLGHLAANATTGFGAGAESYEDVTQLIESLGAAVHAEVTMLVKGSRAMRMERIVQALVGEQRAC